MEEKYKELYDIYYDRYEAILKAINDKTSYSTAYGMGDIDILIGEINTEIELISLASAEECIEVTLIQNNKTDGQIDISAIPASHEALENFYDLKIKVEKLHNNRYLKGPRKNIKDACNEATS